MLYVLAVAVGGTATALLSVDGSARIEGYAVPIGLAVACTASMAPRRSRAMVLQALDFSRARRRAVAALLLVGVAISAAYGLIETLHPSELWSNVIIATMLSTALVVAPLAAQGPARND
ncbi:MAG: hypothetical protein AB7W59_17225 [Acidimicrobiia bacterium]